MGKIRKMLAYAGIGVLAPVWIPLAVIGGAIYAYRERNTIYAGKLSDYPTFWFTVPDMRSCLVKADIYEHHGAGSAGACGAEDGKQRKHSETCADYIIPKASGLREAASRLRVFYWKKFVARCTDFCTNQNNRLAVLSLSLNTGGSEGVLTVKNLPPIRLPCEAALCLLYGRMASAGYTASILRKYFNRISPPSGWACSETPLFPSPWLSSLGCPKIVRSRLSFFIT